MYLPSILSISWSYAAVPIWGWEAVDGEQILPTGNVSSEDGGGSAVPTASTGEFTLGVGVDCAPKPMRMVITGYSWQPIATLEWLANPDWQRWSDNKRDDSMDRARKSEDLRAAQSTPLVPQPDAADPVAGCLRHAQPGDPALKA